MQIQVYTVPNDSKAIPKTLENPITLNGALRNEVDIINPTFEVTSAVPLTCNYCYIQEYSRYYFVTVDTVRTGLYRLRCKCDVLQTYYPQFKSIPCIIGRSTNVFNSYIPDSKRNFFQYTQQTYKNIGDIGAPTTLLMVTVG